MMTLLTLRILAVFLCTIIGTCEGMNFNKCTVKYDLSMCYSTNSTTSSNISPHECNMAQDARGGCRRSYNITYIEMDPFNSLIAQHLIKTCCRNCSTLHTVAQLRDIAHLTPALANQSHFIFPVLGRPNVKVMYGYHFIPFIEPPVVYYITVKDVSMFYHLMKTCIKMWPILVSCLVLAGISGFICWLIETWQNKEEFPRSFLHGWFEGFWWSLITMTTVGYGDKVPKTVAARLFSAFWIIIGIAMFSIVIAMLSSEIIEALYPLPPSLAKLKVGALRHRTYDASIIAQQGGIMVDVEEDSDNEAILELVNKLYKKEIDGMVLDRHAFMAFSTHIYTHKNVSKRVSDHIDFFNTKTIHTQKTHVGSNMAIGILFREHVDYEFFKDFLEDHMVVLNACYGLTINNITYNTSEGNGMHEFSLLLVYGKLFWPAFISVITALVLICLFGIVYEIHRAKYGKCVKMEDYSSCDGREM